MKVKKMHKPHGENDVKNETSGRKLNSFMKDIVMFITEIKLMINNLVEKSNEKKTKRKKNVHIFYKNN